MASHVRVPIQDENLHVHKGKTAAVGKSDALNVQKGFKVRKPLMDRPKHGKNTNAGSSKVSVAKQKPATTIKNNKNVAQNFGLMEEEIKKCNEWAKEGTERIHFSGTDMHNFEKEKTEREMDKEVNMLISSVQNWGRLACLSCLMPIEEPLMAEERMIRCMSVHAKNHIRIFTRREFEHEIGGKYDEVADEHDTDHMLFESEPDLPWSPREQFKDDNFSLIGDGEDDCFLDDEQFCLREFKLKEVNQGVI